MSVSRRDFLKSGATATLAVGLALKFGSDAASGQALRRSDPSQDFPVSTEAQKDPVFSYTRETFDPYVGGIFNSRGVAGKTVGLTLLKVRDCKAAPRSARLASAPPVTKKERETDCFALIFVSSEPLTDLTTIHTLEHAALGKFGLFLTRREGEGKRLYYEAVINHAR